MDPTTPPMAKASPTHRRTHSTPDRVSSGEDTAPTSPMMPSPVSTVDRTTLSGGVTVPPTPSSPPSHETNGASKPMFLHDSNLEDVFEFVCREKNIPEDEKEAIMKHLRGDNDRKKKEQSTRRAPLLATVSDPAGLRSMSDKNGFFIPSNSEVDDFAASSHMGRPVTPGSITAENAQARLPPDACLFVANLPKDKTDAQIYEALVEKFEEFGRCYIKLKRDRGMPIAFVQYHDPNSAVTALELAVGTIIINRKCRIERAKAPRCLYIYRRDGNMPAKAEVLELLAQDGELDKVWSPTETELEKWGLTEGFCCRFKFYQDSIDAIAAHRGDDIYFVDSFHAPDRTYHYVFDQDSYLWKPDASSSTPHYNPSIHLPNALWIGELPPQATKAEIARVFGGQRCLITHIDLRVRYNRPTEKFATYAIVRFLDMPSAREAALRTYKKLCLKTGEPVRIQWAHRSFAHVWGAGHVYGANSAPNEGYTNTHSRPTYMGVPSVHSMPYHVGSLNPYNHGPSHAYTANHYGITAGGMHPHQGVVSGPYNNGGATYMPQVHATFQNPINMNHMGTTYLTPSQQPTQAHMGPFTNGAGPALASSSSINSPGFTLPHSATVQSINPAHQNSTATQANATYPLIVPAPSARGTRSSMGI